MIWLLLTATLAVRSAAEPYGIPQIASPFNYGKNYYYSYPQQSTPILANSPQVFVDQVVPSPQVFVDQVVPSPQVFVEQVVETPEIVVPGPPLPGPPAPPLGIKCPQCTGGDCCDLCVERSCAAPEELSLLELALNPFFYVKYVEDCAQAQFLDNICFLFVPLLDLASLFTFAQIITFQDGTVEQRQYQVECVNDAFQFVAIGSGCRFKYEIIYADILCGVYIFQRCFENPCCQVDSGPIQIVTTALPAAQECLAEALVFAQKLYPCKVFIELPQENASLCTVLGNTFVPSHLN